MGAAAGKNPPMILDCSGEGSFAVPEQLRLDERFRKLREVYLNEVAREALCKAVFLLVERDKA